MIQTIAQGSCVQVQGAVVATLPNGKVVVRVGDKHFEGKPIGAMRPIS